MAQKRGRSTMRSAERELEKVIGPRREQYLIAKRPGPPLSGAEPLDFNAVRTALEQDPDIRINRILSAPGPGPLAAGLATTESIVVATMPEERAEQLSRLPQLVVEPDHPLVLEAAAVAPIPDPGVIAPPSTAVTISISVVGAGQAPVEGARVYLFGSAWPAQAVTNANGQAQLTLFGEPLASVRGLYVRPAADYWSLWIPRPALDPDGANMVALEPLDEAFPEFPNQQVVGWGLEAMRFDQLPPSYRGRGIKVAMVDSGVATSHQDLRSVVKGGYNSVAGDAGTWNRDEAGHGSHCAGIIAGGEGRGIRGLAPDAEIYALKAFPDGTLSTLIDALNRCIELQVDVINLSVGIEQYSELLEHKLQEVKDHGIASIASAGSSGGPVQFPASSPNVLAVAAIGKADEFPEGSYHATTLREDSPAGADSYFSPRFTRSGPEIDVCAPGVAILSCAPPDSYAVCDGTSMAASYVSGLAALILAHHPDFQGAYKARNARRVERLFQIIQQSARPLDLGDRDRTGVGLPDAVNALTGTRPSESEVLSEDLMQQLVAAFRAGQTRPGNGAAVFQQLLGALHRAGISPSMPVDQAPQFGLQGGVAIGAIPLGPPLATPDPSAGLQQLRDAMQRAGLLTAKQAAAAAKGGRRRPGTSSQPSPGGQPSSLTNSDAVQSRQLREVMKQSGLI
jgi:subtilisin